MELEIETEIEIDAVPALVWATLGERFMHYEDWAGPIEWSRAAAPSPLGVGSQRLCQMRGFGPVKPGTLTEQLVTFDADTFSLSYEVVAGMPSFVSRSRSDWWIEALGADRSRVCVRASLTLHGALALASRLLRAQLRARGSEVLEELKHWLERGVPHPRKRAAQRDGLPASASAPR